MSLLKLWQKNIHQPAVKIYKKDFQNFVDMCSGLNQEQLAMYFICGTWLWAGIQNEGRLRLPDGKILITPKLEAYPLTISLLNEFIIEFKKKKLETEAFTLKFWLHSCRAMYIGELREEFDKLWSLILPTKELWDKYLDVNYNFDKNRIDDGLLQKTLVLTKEILKNLPPEPEHNI